MLSTWILSITPATFLSIPSPSQNQISLGPLPLRAYGLLIALGVLAGVWLASRRLAEDGLDPEIIPNLALWVLPSAIIGARIYFVLTNWGRFADDLGSAFRLWEGGLGIPGGVALGTAVGVWWLRRNDVPLPPVFTAVALGLPLGQIIGRFGNWFNQELYGRPTDLPWALEIDEAHRLAGYENEPLFHPTFAYEILWNIGLLFVLLRIDKSKRLRPGALFAVYLIGYGIGRILIETVRIDPVNSFLGIRLHIWAMIVFIAAAVYYLWRHGLAGDASDAEPADPGSSAKGQAPFVGPGAKRAKATAEAVAATSVARTDNDPDAGRADAEGAGSDGADTDVDTERAESETATTARTAKDRAADAKRTAAAARKRAAETKAKLGASSDDDA